jgi:hypothetical protein
MIVDFFMIKYEYGLRRYSYTTKLRKILPNIVSQVINFQLVRMNLGLLIFDLRFREKNKSKILHQKSPT